MRSLKLVLGELGMLLGAGLLWLGATDHALPSSLHLMFKMLPMSVWGVAFVSYGLFRWSGAFSGFPVDTSVYTRYIGPLFGAWLWGCMFLAGVMMVDFNVTTLLYAIPMQLEIWIMIQAALWWTKYDPEELRTVPGALSPAPDYKCNEDRDWKQTEIT